MCTWMWKLWQHLSNKDDEERVLRHKGDLPTTWTDTFFIVMHLGETDYTTGVSTTRSRNWIGEKDLSNRQVGVNSVVRVANRLDSVTCDKSENMCIKEWIPNTLPRIPLPLQLGSAFSTRISNIPCSIPQTVLSTTREREINAVEKGTDYPWSLV